MPDPDFKTISSSQIPELLGFSTWGTRFTLFHQFQRRVSDARVQTNRMRIGKLFESLILELVAEKLTLEVKPNRDADGNPAYIRHVALPLGCTEDAAIFCPTRGHGTVEAKAVDKFEWKENWTDKSAPKIYEAQLQEQMLVKGDTWGIIACFVYNDGSDGILHLYERRPHRDAQARIAAEAVAFFADLAANNAPSPFGLPVELDLLTELYPEADPRKILDATADYDTAELARLYAWTVAQKASFERAEKEMKPKLLGYLKDAGGANLAGGVSVRINKPVVAGNVVMLPADLRKRLAALYAYLNDGEYPHAMLGAITDAIEWCHVVKQPSIQNRLTIRENESATDSDVEPRNVMEAG